MRDLKVRPPVPWSVGRERLKLLMKRLRSVDPSSFSYYTWFDGRWHENEDGVGCGTTACALGHAALIPELREAGLATRRSGVGASFCGAGGVCMVERIGEKEPVDNRHAYEAGAIVFGLEHVESLFLFQPDTSGWNHGYPWRGPGAFAGPISVAGHIENFIVRKDQIEREKKMHLDFQAELDRATSRRCLPAPAAVVVIEEKVEEPAYA